MLLVFLACASPETVEPLPERDIFRVQEGSWSLADGAALSQDDAGLRITRGQTRHTLAIAVVGEPAIAADGRRLVVSHRDDGMTISALDAVSLTGEAITRRRLVSDGSPDRVAITADGRWVAYVSGQTGIASVWVVPFDGGEPVQLTNVGLEALPRTPGAPPEGFIPPPHEGPLVIDGEWITWSSPEGEHAVRLP